jgi:hypothetical protein
VTVLRRDGWYEIWDGHVLAIDKWTGDAESLLTALKETGWFSDARSMYDAAENAVFQHVWLGTDDDGETAVCYEDGYTPGNVLLSDHRPATVVDLTDVLG